MYKVFLLLAALALSAVSCRRAASGALGGERSVLAVCADSAELYIDRQDFSAAMMQLKHAEKFAGDTGDTLALYRVYHHIGWINETLGADERALQYFDKAMTAARAMARKDLMVDVLINQANVLYNMNRPDSAWHITLEAKKLYPHADRSQRSQIMKNIAYREMLAGELVTAEEHAYKAALLAEDFSAAGNAVSLLCYIYLKQNKDERAQMLMSILPKGDATLQYNRLLVKSDYLEKHGDYRGALDAYKQLKEMSDSLKSSGRNLDILRVQSRMDQEIQQREKLEQRLWFSLAIIVLLLVIFGLTVWYYRRTQALYKRFRDRISEVRQDLALMLGRRDATIEELKRSVDEKVGRLDALKEKLPARLAGDQNYDSIAQTKLGIDTLHAILCHSNISQMGRREQKAVAGVMWNIDRRLAAIIDNPDNALTPKETFFCIMERNGMPDAEKARSFCCSEQAVRSTKSRLCKKLDLAQIVHLSPSP